MKKTMKIIDDLKLQVEEATRIKNDITSQLKEKGTRFDDQEKEAKNVIANLTCQLQEKDEAYQIKEIEIALLEDEP